MSKIRVSAVSYTNTKPFIYGLEKSGILNTITLSLDNPAQCAQKLQHGDADIGLIPVAALSNIHNCEITSDYCIGANGPVHSVFIFSRCPIQQVRTLKLDAQSRTSNALAVILIKQHWKLDVTIVTEGESDAYVEIGDRTFGKCQTVPYCYDLAEVWKDFTGMPFTFAVWVANRSVPKTFLERFNAALALGVTNRHELVQDSSEGGEFDLNDYLLNKIDYNFDEPKKMALSLFLGYLKEVNI